MIFCRNGRLAMVASPPAVEVSWFDPALVDPARPARKIEHSCRCGPALPCEPWRSHCQSQGLELLVQTRQVIPSIFDSARGIQRGFP